MFFSITVCQTYESAVNINEPYGIENQYEPHNPIKTNDNEYIVFVPDTPLNEDIEFSTLPNGTSVDTRVDS